ncbi:HTH-type transcriptional repressor KstR2 [Pseudoalteromonas sp. P1-9]|uniref:TetR/AcrR family transcriptional regulator n=1 Tax=Pseudoalteromonas sp. P1-9 TaxID=1710354 RepID=UPI0006D6285E|nr:TetR/AcrR family transcriptional regulator [Pseudoalteromonas sp. P1-9]KPV94857.1 HTH-type transcriptional repressor KstR2 [Pseudoalteromonas sp. P1-9]
MGNSKKQTLLDAALTLFVAQGISETSTASIAKHAGVATGTLFHHFENKKVLVEALYLSLKQELVASLQLNNAINSNEQALSVWRSAIKWGLDNPEKFSFFTIYYASPWLEVDFKQGVLNSVFYFLTEYIELQKQQGNFVALPTDFIAMHIQQSLINTILYLSHEQANILDVEKLIDNSFNTCLFGLICRN